MQPEQLIEKSAQAIRGTKYYSGGNRDWKGLPVTHIEKRYATAAIARVLRELADMRVQLDPQGLRWWALEIEKAGGDQ